MSARQGSRPRPPCSSDGTLETMRAERYAGWDTEDGKALLESATLEELPHAGDRARQIQPEPRSGKAGAAREHREPVSLDSVRF